MERLTPEQMEMRIFHLTEANAAPLTEVFSLKDDIVLLYLNLLDQELPRGLHRDLKRLAFFNLYHTSQVVLLENLLTQGMDGVVSWALEDAWNLTQDEEKRALERKDPLGPSTYVLAEAASQRFHRLIMESKEYKDHFDGWGRFQGNKFSYEVDVQPWLNSLDRKSTQILRAGHLRERIEFHPDITFSNNGEGISLNDLMRFMSHYDEIVPDPLFTHADEDDVWSNGYHTVFTEENLSTLPGEAKDGLFREMFQAQELFTKERILEFKELVDEYNFQWAVASFDWSGGGESSILTQMRKYVATSPYSQEERAR